MKLLASRLCRRRYKVQFRIGRWFGWRRKKARQKMMPIDKDLKSQK